MNDTATNPTVAAIQEQLKRLEWMIPDAKKRVAKAAEQMLWRAQRAVEDATAMLNDQPCCLSWTDFADGDLRVVRSRFNLHVVRRVCVDQLDRFTTKESIEILGFR